MKENDFEKISEVLDLSGGDIHLVGVCGIGMAGLAFLLKSRGFTVTGCDAACNNLTGWLERHDIRVFSEHDPEHINQSIALVVKTSAVSDNNPEIEKAYKAGICVASRGAVLACLARKNFSICVCGTHGKTTTTAMLAQGMNNAGRPVWFAVGGECAGLPGVAGGSGSVIVLEADESDKTLLFYKPDIAVITNIEYEHAESFRDLDELKDCFKQLVANTSGKVVYCADDCGAASVCAGLPNAVGYGFSDAADLKITLRDEASSYISFDLSGSEIGGVAVSLPVSGKHNALNAAAAIAAAFCAGADPRSFSKALAGFLPARRRFEKIIETEDLLVVSDYAHHPSEIATAISTARMQKRSRIVAVFQPHRFSRTKAFAGDFPGAFDGIDILLLLPVYPASEQPVSGGAALDLYEFCRAHGKYDVIYASSLESGWRCLKKILRKDDALLIIGAGDVENISSLVRHEISEAGFPSAWMPVEERAEGLRLPDSDIRRNEPLASKTTLGVGGNADIFVMAGSLDDLRRIFEWCRRNKVRPMALGGGSNVLVSDAGTRFVVRQQKSVFGKINVEGQTLVAGAAAGLCEFVDYCVANGLGGFEFLYGIPGTIGGALRMNAGAFGSEIGNMVRWVEYVDSKGELGLSRNDELEFLYRNTPALDNVMVTRAGFDFEKKPSGIIEGLVNDVRDRRDWMRGLRCAGSVFKNPAGQSAGKLLEEAGVKLFRIGGASVSERHANVIIANPGAKASDVLALIHKMREAVKSRFGIELDSEVVCFE